MQSLGNIFMNNLFKIMILPVLAVFLLGGCSSSVEEMSKHDSSAGKCQAIGGPDGIIDMAKSKSINRLVITEEDGTNDDGTIKYKHTGIISWLVGKVMGVIKNASLKMYLKIAVNLDFRFLVAMMMTLSVVLFAASVLLGLTQANGYNALMFVLKLIIIYQLTINYFYFYTYVIQTFEAIVTDTMMFSSLTFSDYLAVDPTIICLGLFGQACDIANIIGTMFFPNNPNFIEGLVTNLFGDGDAVKKLYLFGAFDDTISFMFDVRMWKLIMALAGTGISGIFWAVMLMLMNVIYLFAIIAAVKVYLLSYIARWALYGLGPIFISFALFRQTKSLFDGWLQQLISFTLQPVMLFIFLGMFQSMISGFTTQLYIDIGDPNSGYANTMDCPTFDISKFDPTLGINYSDNGPQWTTTNNQADPACAIAQCDQSDPQCFNEGGVWQRFVLQLTADAQPMCVKWTTFNTEGGSGGETLYWYRLCQQVGSKESCINSSTKPVIPIDIWMVMAIIVMCYLMFAMCSWVTEVANSLAGGAMSMSSVTIMGWDTLKQGVGSGVTGLFKTGGGGGGGGGGRPPGASR